MNMMGRDKYGDLGAGYDNTVPGPFCEPEIRRLARLRDAAKEEEDKAHDREDAAREAAKSCGEVERGRKLDRAADRATARRRAAEEKHYRADRALQKEISSLGYDDDAGQEFPPRHHDYPN